MRHPVIRSDDWTEGLDTAVPYVRGKKPPEHPYKGKAHFAPGDRVGYKLSFLETILEGAAAASKRGEVVEVHPEDMSSLSGWPVVKWGDEESPRYVNPYVLIGVTSASAQ